MRTILRHENHPGIRGHGKSVNPDIKKLEQEVQTLAESYRNAKSDEQREPIKRRLYIAIESILILREQDRKKQMDHLQLRVQKLKKT